MIKTFLTSLAGLCTAAGIALAQTPAPIAYSGSTGRPAVNTMSEPFPSYPTTAVPPNAVPYVAGPSAACPSGDCAPTGTDCFVCGPSGRFWVGAEYLFWSTKSSSLPVLATRGAPGDAIPGALGQPGTRSLYSGDDDDWRSGGRFMAGFWLNRSQTIGFEASYFFLGSHSNTFSAGDTGAPGSSVIARPFVAISPVGAASFANSQLVAFPGITAGNINIQNSTQLQGFAPVGLFNLCCVETCGAGQRFDLIGGFQWLRLNDSVNINEDIRPIAAPGSAFPPGMRIGVNDQFTTQNDFYGFQVGGRGELRRDRFFVNGRALVGLGTTHQHVSINGSTAFTPAGGSTVVQPGGLLAQPSNAGSYSRDVFSAVPEIGVNVGYQLTPHLRAYVGYTFMYWSNVVRPGDVIDTGVNASQIPTAAGPGTLVGPARPSFVFHESDFWAQGINLGIQFNF